MSREKELIKNTVILSIGQLLPKLTSFITLPILTGYLTKAEYGTYDLLTTMIMLVMPIATLQIQSAAFRFLIDCRNSENDKSCIITSICFLTIPVSLLVSVGILFLFPQFDLQTRLIISLYFFTDAIYSTLGQITRGLGNNKIFSICSIMVSIINMIGIVIGVYLTRQGLQGLIVALTGGQVLGILYFCVRDGIGRYLSPAFFSRKKLKEMLSYSWPMIPNSLSTWVLKLSDRLVITAFLGVNANAVYAVANKIPNLLSMGQQIIAMAWQENASVSANDKDAGTYYSRMLERTFDAMFGLTALLVAATPIIFALFIKGDYNEAYYQMPILILAMFFYVMSAFMGGIYIAHKKTKNVGISTMVAAIINLGIDLCFVQTIGIYAGSLSTLTAYTVLYVYRLINCRHFQPMQYNLKKQAIQLVVIVVMLVLCYLNTPMLNIVNMALAVFVTWFYNKKMIDLFLKWMAGVGIHKE